jgi:choline-sulfatase
MATPPNILLITADQHRRDAAGCYGHPRVRTPHLDRLAAQGVRFERAYCNSPICGPSRISLMTGRHLHELGLWCNGVPWNGRAQTWAARLREAGYRTISRGKMDVPGPHGSVGFEDFQEPIPRAACNPWPLREPRVYDRPGFHFDGFMDWPHAGQSREERLRECGLAPDRLHVTNEAGAYQTGYYDHDRLTTDAALAALRHHGRRGPWAMHVGLLQPHWPFLCPQEFLDLYPAASVDLPIDFRLPNPALHQTLRHYQATQNDFRAIAGEAHLRRIIAAYCGMITCLDRLVGELLTELERQGLADNTFVIYTADHGEGLGTHGLFDKLTPYEESVAVPLIIRGPGVRPGRVAQPVSLVDLYPTILECARVPLTEAERAELPGRSLLAAGTRADDRPILSEYHGIFLRDSWFLLVQGSRKYTHYVGRRPSLFDLAGDPHELCDLHARPASQPVLRRLESQLRAVVDVEAVAARAARDLAKPGRGGGG